MRRSPIYAHFDETVSGATSIRAYRRQGIFIDKAEQLIDDSQRPFFILSAAQRLVLYDWRTFSMPLLTHRLVLYIRSEKPFFYIICCPEVSTV